MRQAGTPLPLRVDGTAARLRPPSLAEGAADEPHRRPGGASAHTPRYLATPSCVSSEDRPLTSPTVSTTIGGQGRWPLH